MTIVSGYIRFMRILAGVPWGGGIKRLFKLSTTTIFSVFAGYFFGNFRDVLLYACECFNRSCCEVLQLCRAWRCVYWKVFKVSTDKVVHFIQPCTGLCALESEISCRKLSFIRKLFSSPNSVIKRLAKLNL